MFSFIKLVQPTMKPKESICRNLHAGRSLCLIDCLHTRSKPQYYNSKGCVWTSMASLDCCEGSGLELFADCCEGSGLLKTRGMFINENKTMEILSKFKSRALQRNFFDSLNPKKLSLKFDQNRVS